MQPQAGQNPLERQKMDGGFPLRRPIRAMRPSGWQGRSLEQASGAAPAPCKRNLFRWHRLWIVDA